LGYLSLRQQRKVTRAPAGDRNARCASGNLATPSGKSKITNIKTPIDGIMERL
jgi:hypothetical protein